MKRLVVLGAGTAGTIVVNKLRSRLPESSGRSPWSIRATPTTTSPGTSSCRSASTPPSELVKPRREFMPERRRPGPRRHRPRAARGRTWSCSTTVATLAYDYLVIATGTSPRPDQTPGMTDPRVAPTVHDFYTLEGAKRLRRSARPTGPVDACRAHHRDADQVPGGAAGVHASWPRPTSPSEGHARPRRDRLRDPARGRVHQAGGRPSTSAACSRSAGSRSRPTSSSTASTPRPGPCWSRWTSARFPSTCS